MTTTNTDAKMTLDEAKVYLQDKTEFMKFDEALAIVKAAGENDFLASLGLTGDAEVKTDRQNRAAAYLPTARISEDYEGLYKIGEALDSQEIMIEADDAFQRYAEANHIEINKDDQVTMNIRRMDHDAKGLIEELKQDSSTKQLRDSINIVDEENDFAPVSDAEREKLFNGLLESAKNQVISDRAAEDELFKLSADKRRQEIRDSIKSTFQNKMLVAIGASNDMHLTEATKKKSFSFQNYAKGVIRRLAEITNSGKKADVHKGQLINSMVDTQLRMEERAKLYRQLGMVNAANAIEKQKTGFVSKMKGWFGKAYEMRHAVADNMKNNKYKYITMGLAGVGVALTTPHVSAGKAAVIAAGYAAFIGAGSVVWPLIEKREAMLRQAKKDKNDELIAELNSQGKVKSLWNIFKSMEGEEKKRYLQRAAVNTAAGVAGGLLIGAAGFVGQEANMATLVNAKLGASTMRIFGNLGVQSKFMVEDHRQAKKDQTEESRQKSKMSKISFGVTAVAALISETIGLAHAYLSGDETPTTSGGKAQGALDQHQGKGGKGAEILEQKPAAKAPTAEELAAQKAAEEATQQATLVSTEYAGTISQEHYNEMLRKITGIYKEHADWFGKQNSSPEEAMQKMYQNIENARKGGYFDGQSNEQVVYKFMKSIEQTEMAHKEGKFWVTTLDSNGLPMYYNNQEEMRALTRIIICGEKVDASAAKLNGVLNLVDEKKGAYIGEGVDRGVTNNRYIGGTYKCPDGQGNYQNAWEEGRPRAPKTIHHEEPAPKQVKLNDELRNEDTSRQVNLNEEVENQDVKRGAVWEEERGTTIDGKNQHPNMLRSGNHVKSQGIEI